LDANGAPSKELMAQGVHRCRQFVGELPRQIVQANVVGFTDIGTIQRRNDAHFVLEALRETDWGNKHA
jgi:hypothetical protein